MKVEFKFVLDDKEPVIENGEELNYKCIVSTKTMKDEAEMIKFGQRFLETIVKRKMRLSLDNSAWAYWNQKRINVKVLPESYDLVEALTYD